MQILKILKSNQLESLDIGGEKIEQVNSFKYLGLTFDNKINSTLHNKSIISLVKPRLYMFRRYASFGATPEQLSHIFNSMILSMITYNCQAFYEARNTIDKHKLQLLAKRCRQPCNIAP